VGLSVAVVSAVYGGYDVPAAAPDGFDDAVLVTDQPMDVPGWRVVVWPQPGRHPRLAAKVAKFRPDWFTACDASVWIDGNMHTTGPGLRAAVEQHLADDDLVLWRHPENRDCLLDEARYCHQWPKYVDWPVLAQAEHYIAVGMPRHWGLYCCNLIARRHNWRTAELGLAWLAENESWSIQDQVSLPYLLWERNWQPATWQVGYANNPWLRWNAHRDSH
jgi:hypothetical protein